MHLMLLSSFLLIFIPNVDHSKEEDKLNLNKVFFGIQTLILLAYFVSGFFKIWGIIDQELGGLTSALASESMGLNLGKTMLASNSTYFLSDYVLNNPSPIFAFLLIAGYLIELFSIYVIFKPHYHRTWGILLILLHVGILLMVGPDFTSQIIIVGIFFVYSPFSKQGDIWGEVLAIIKNWKYRLQNRKNTKEIIIFYDGECLMCNGFLKYLAKFDLPSELRISTIQSERFEQLKATHTGLDEIDSIVILETDNNDQQTIRIKANGIVWVMGRIKKRFLLLKLAYKVFPLPGNVVYDIVAKNRKKADPNNCPIPPQNIREILLD